MTQPTPKVSRADVERIVRRDFPPDAFSGVLKVLDEYGVTAYQREKARVQLAALKLASGSQERLRREIEEAKLDYRDVLSPAEYPGYSFEVSKLAKKEQKKVVDADWKQYSDWLTR